MKQFLIFFSVLFFFLSIGGCAPFKPDNTHAGICNELNSQMIFGGNTSNVRKANIQNAEEPLVQRTYDRKCDR